MANPVLHHINLKTTRLQEMIDWYGVVVGTEVTHQFEGGAWLALKDQGIVPHACLDHGMTMSFYYADPDGNSVELI